MNNLEEKNLIIEKLHRQEQEKTEKFLEKLCHEFNKKRVFENGFLKFIDRTF